MTRRIRIIADPKPLDPERFVAVVVAQAMAQLAADKLAALNADEPEASGEEGGDD